MTTPADRREFARLRWLAFPESYRAAATRYRNTACGKAVHAAGCRRYALTKKGRASARRRQERYRRSAQGRVQRARYFKSEAGKALTLRKNMAHRARRRSAFVRGAASAIRAIYDRAAWYRSQGWNVAVDHIFPLGFGWHEPANLQIIFTSENSAKGSRIDFIPSVIFD